MEKMLKERIDIMEQHERDENPELAKEKRHPGLKALEEPMERKFKDLPLAPTEPKPETKTGFRKMVLLLKKKNMILTPNHLLKKILHLLLRNIEKGI
jgi:hypothetical protein